MSADNMIVMLEVKDGVEIYDINFSCISSADYWYGLPDHTPEALYEGIRRDYKHSFCEKVASMDKANRWFKAYIKNYICEYGEEVIMMPESMKKTAK